MHQTFKKQKNDDGKYNKAFLFKFEQNVVNNDFPYILNLEMCEDYRENCKIKNMFE